MRSLRRVEDALLAAGLDVRVLELGDCRTAADAARACGCVPDQIAKSIILRGAVSGHCRLFLTAGGNRVDPAKAADFTAGIGAAPVA